MAAAYCEGVASCEPEALERVVACLTKNRANTLPFMEILKACETERPYREVEDEVVLSPFMGQSLQNAHVLVGLLIDAGALHKHEISEPSSGAPATGAAAHETAALEAGAFGSDCTFVLAPGAAAPISMPESRAERSLPDDYMLVLSEAGRRALAEFQPVSRFSAFLDQAPASYADACLSLLESCEAGRTRAEIEALLSGHPALSFPQPVYPGFFISKVETVGGIAWREGRWRTTSAGLDMEEACRQALQALKSGKGDEEK